MSTPPPSLAKPPATSSIDDTPSFESIWSSFEGVELEMEEAFLRMALAHAHIITAKDAYVKLSEGHARVILQWRVNSSELKPVEMPMELERVCRACKGTGDVVEGATLLGQAHELFHAIQSDTEVEDHLLEHWRQLQRHLADVNRSSLIYVLDFSLRLNPLVNNLNEETEAYVKREAEILAEAENALERTMCDRFKAYRLEKVRAFSDSIQERYEKDLNQRLVQLDKQSSGSRTEHKAMDVLKEEISQLKIAYSEHPLTRCKQLNALNEELAAREQALAHCKKKLALLRTVKEREHEEVHKQKERHALEEKGKEREEAQKEEADRRLRKKGRLVYVREQKRKRAGN